MTSGFNPEFASSNMELSFLKTKEIYNLIGDNFSFQNNRIKKCTCWKTMGFLKNQRDLFHLNSTCIQSEYIKP